MAVMTIMKKVKEIHPEEIALVKVGNFYQVFGKDSFIISYLLGYRMQELKENIYKCGFSTEVIS